jgi:Holliday junction resolvasome RuvABC endonuclease subunit
MITASFDIATKISGVAIFKEELPIYYGLLKAKNTNLDHRLIEMKKLVITQIELYKPNYIVFEKESPSSVNRNATFALCRMNGIMRCVCDDFNLPNIMPDIREWRAHFGIGTGMGWNRERQKEMAIAKVKELFGIVTDSDDVAEALLIGKWFIDNRKKMSGV